MNELSVLVAAIFGAVLVYSERGPNKPIPHGVLTFLELFPFSVMGYLSGDLLGAAIALAGGAWLITGGTGYLINPRGPDQPLSGSDGIATFLQKIGIIRENDGRAMGAAGYWVMAISIGAPVGIVAGIIGYHFVLAAPLVVLGYWKLAPIIADEIDIETEYVGAAIFGFIVYRLLWV